MLYEIPEFSLQCDVIPSMLSLALAQRQCLRASLMLVDASARCEQDENAHRDYISFPVSTCPFERKLEPPLRATSAYSRPPGTQ